MAFGTSTTVNPGDESAASDEEAFEVFDGARSPGIAGREYFVKSGGELLTGGRADLPPVAEVS